MDTVTTGRAKRSTAGNRMRELLEQAHQEGEKFVEDDNDAEFEAPQDMKDVYLEEFADTDDELEDEDEEMNIQREERRQNKSKAVFNPLVKASRVADWSTLKPRESDLALLDPNIDIDKMAPSTLILEIRKKRREQKRQQRSETRRSNLRASTLKSEVDLIEKERAEKVALASSRKGRKAQHETGEVRGARPMTQDELIAAALEEEDRNKEALTDWLKKEEERRELRRVGRKRVRGPRWTWISRTVGKLVEVVDERESQGPSRPPGEESVKRVEAGDKLQEGGRLQEPPDQQPESGKPGSAESSTACKTNDSASASGAGSAETATAAVDKIPAMAMNDASVSEDVQDASGSSDTLRSNVPAASDPPVPAASDPPVPASDAPVPISDAPLSASGAPVPAPEAPVLAATDDALNVGNGTPASNEPRASNVAPESIKPVDVTPAPTDANAPTTAASGTENDIKAGDAKPAVESGLESTPAAAPRSDSAAPPAKLDKSDALNDSALNDSATVSGAPDATKNIPIGSAAPDTDNPNPVPEAPTGPYTRNYLILSQVPGGLPAELSLILGDHVDWSELRVIPARNRPINRKPPLDPLCGLPAKYRHPDSMVPYSSVESYKTLKGVLDGRYVWSEAGWWAGGEADAFADGIGEIEGWREATSRGWLGGKEVKTEPVEEVQVEPEVEVEEPEEVVEPKTRKGKRKAEPRSRKSKRRR